MHTLTWSVPSSGLSSVEAYNPKINEWVFVAPMNTRRSSVGVGVVDGEHSIQMSFSKPLSLKAPLLP